jgi:hypothetical protein
MEPAGQQWPSLVGYLEYPGLQGAVSAPVSVAFPPCIFVKQPLRKTKNMAVARKIHRTSFELFIFATPDIVIYLYRDYWSMQLPGLNFFSL